MVLRKRGSRGAVFLSIIPIELPCALREREFLAIPSRAFDSDQIKGEKTTIAFQCNFQNFFFAKSHLQAIALTNVRARPPSPAAALASFSTERWSSRSFSSRSRPKPTKTVRPPPSDDEGDLSLRSGRLPRGSSRFLGAARPNRSRGGRPIRRALCTSLHMSRQPPEVESRAYCRYHGQE